MKKLLIILLLFTAFRSVAQQDIPANYIWYRYTYGTRVDRTWADKALHVPRDTIYTKSGLAIKGSSLYYGDSTRWYLAGTVTGGGGLSGGNLGAFYRYYVPSLSGIKTAAPGLWVLIDSSSNVNALTYKIDSAALASYIRSTIPGSSGVTNLSYTASPTNGIVASSTGTDATIPLVNTTNAGLMGPDMFDTLNRSSYIVTPITGHQVAFPVSYDTLRIKSLVAGSNITLTDNDDSTITIASTGGSGTALANFYLKDSSFSSDRTASLNGKKLLISDGAAFSSNGLYIDPTSGGELAVLQAHNTTAGDNDAYALMETSNTLGQITLNTQFNGVTKSSMTIISQSGQSGALITGNYGTVLVDTFYINSTLAGSSSGWVWTLNNPVNGAGHWAAATGGGGTVSDVTATLPITSSGGSTPNISTSMATGSLIYRKTAGTGVMEVNTLATLKTDLGLTGTNSGDQTITLTNDITGSGTGTIPTTLATVNSNVGSFTYGSFTVNGKGLITAASSGTLPTYYNTSIGTGKSIAVNFTNNIKSLRDSTYWKTDSAIAGTIRGYIDTSGLFTAVRASIQRDRFGVAGEDVRATGARYFSAASNSFTLDSMGAFRMISHPQAAARKMQMAFTDGTDSSYLDIGGSTLAVTREASIGTTSTGGSSFVKARISGGSSIIDLNTTNNSGANLSSLTLNSSNSDLATSNAGGTAASHIILYNDSLVLKQTAGLYRFDLLPTTSDTTNYKPVVADINGRLKRATNGGGGGGGGGSVTSVALSMPSAFSVSGSPITSSGTLAVTGAGSSAQYIKGDGSLGTYTAGGQTLQQIFDLEADQPQLNTDNIIDVNHNSFGFPNSFDFHITGTDANTIFYLANLTTGNRLNIRDTAIEFLPYRSRLYIDSLASTIDTTSFKPMAINPVDGKVVRFNSWGNLGLGGGGSTPTWEATQTQQSTTAFTANHTTDMGGKYQYWSNMKLFQIDVSDQVYINGLLGAGVAVPTAILHLKAGTATANTSPLKFTSGTNLTTAEAGAMEWNGTNLFITQTTGPTRKTIAYTSDITGTVTATGGALTSNSVVLGAGTTDTKVVAGITTDGTSILNLGVNTTTIGKVKMFGNTSGDATIQPAAVAGTATVVTLPAATGTLATLAGIETLTNKRWTARVGNTTSSATPTINTDNTDVYKLTAQTADITSFTTNLSGTPVDGDVLEIQITGTAARAITWGASFVASTVALPTTTVTTATLTTIFQYYTTSSYGNNKWVCVNSF